MNGDEINAAVESAFEKESETVETPVVDDPKPVDEPKGDEPKSDTPPETPADEPKTTDEPKGDDKPADAPKDEKGDDKPADEMPPAPQQLRGDFAHNKWASLDKETQDELSRLCVENERNYKRAAEAEYKNQDLRKKIEPVQGYISEVAESAKISDADVIRNCVDIVQNLNDKPDLTARQMIAGGMIRFADPVAVVKEIARAYGLDLTGELHEKDIPVSTQVDAARAKYEARQSKYVQPRDTDAEHAKAINEYVESVPSIKAIYTNDATRDRFLRQITMERQVDPYASDITIINRAAEIFEGRVVARPAPAPETPTQTPAEQKLNKVVSIKASNPVETAPANPPHEDWTPENVNQKSATAATDAVRAAMRTLGYDD